MGESRLEPWGLAVNRCAATVPHRNHSENGKYAEEFIHGCLRQMVGSEQAIYVYRIYSVNLLCLVSWSTATMLETRFMQG